MGKILKVNELEIKAGGKDHEVSVFAVFKTKKHSDLYVIFTDNYSDDKEKLYYGSAHIRIDTLVILNSKKSDKDEELIKEFTWKLLNTNETEGFEVVDITGLNKAEIISFDYLEVKKEVITGLTKKTIPKPEPTKAEIREQAKSNSSAYIIYIGIFLSLVVVGVFCFVNKDLFTGIKESYTCVLSDADTDLEATLTITQKLSFDRDDNIMMRTITSSYKFDREEGYSDYVNMGSYYQEETFFENSSVSYQTDMANFTFNLIEEVLIDDDYSGNKTKTGVINELTEEDYICTQDR